MSDSLLGNGIYMCWVLGAAIGLREVIHKWGNELYGQTCVVIMQIPKKKPDEW